MALIDNVEFFPHTYSDFMQFFTMHCMTYENGQPMRIKAIELEPIQEAALWTEGTFSFTQEAAQALMDRLWNCGIRPTEGAGSAGAMSAVQLHLEDMRRINDRLFDKVLED
jgi:hypothetical protein